MINTLTQNKLKIIGIVVLLAGVAWYVLSSSDTNTSSDSLVTTETSVTINDIDQDVVVTLLKLRAIQLSNGIFSDASFTSLKDFSVPIVPEPIGRPDPFAPLVKSAPIPTSMSSKTKKSTPSFRASSEI